MNHDPNGSEHRIINKRLWGFWPFGSFYPQHFPLFGNTPRMKKLFQWISNPWPQALLDKPQWLWFKPLPTRYIYKTHICIYTYVRIVSSQSSASLLRLVSNKVLVKDLEICVQVSVWDFQLWFPRKSGL